MSFSQDIKDEIIAHKNKKCCLDALRYGEMVTEETKPDFEKEIAHNIKKKLCCKKAYIKGVFLGSGCIVNPENDYHFEVSFRSKKTAEYTKEILEYFGIKAKCIKRQAAQHVVYVKESEQISTILRILEANKSMLEFENIRVEKSIKNDINRSINCETANLAKTVNTSIHQIKAIDKIIENGKFKDLPIELQEVCNLRKEYPESSIGELATMCKTPLSKSGMNHRLNKLIKIAGEI